MMMRKSIGYHVLSVLSRSIRRLSSSRKVAFVRQPSSILNEGIVTHIESSIVNVQKAVKQWNDYCTIMRQSGWEVIELPPPTSDNSSHPDSVFVEDVLLVNNENDKLLITHPGDIRRVGELNYLYSYLIDDLHISKDKLFYLNERQEDGVTLDGGDVLKIPALNLLYVGQGGRTSSKGIQRLKKVFSEEHIMEVPISKVLHCKSAFTALPSTQIIYWPPAICERGLMALDTDHAATSREGGEQERRRGRGEPLIALEEAGAHVVILDHHNNTLLMASSAHRTAAMLEQRGHKVVRVDISEYEKLEGCVTCLSVRIRDFQKLLS